MTLTQRGSSLYEAKFARQIEELRQNGVTIQIIQHADYLHVERNSYGFCVVLVPKTVIDFVHFSLESGIVFEGATVVYEHFCRLVPNE